MTLRGEHSLENRKPSDGSALGNIARKVLKGKFLDQHGMYCSQGALPRAVELSYPDLYR